MSQPDLSQLIEDYHRTIDAFVAGNPEPQKRLWSHRDDVTLANPLGPPAKGWAHVEAILEQAASSVRDGELISVESISEFWTADLGYNLELERTRSKLGGMEEMTTLSLRVTTVFRREDAEWKIVHRHADPTTTSRTVESLAAQAGD
jgi:ketosteroid isomerase-like protein